MKKRNCSINQCPFHPSGENSRTSFKKRWRWSEGGGEPVRFLLSQYALARASQSPVFPSGCLALSVFVCQTNLRLLTTVAQRGEEKKGHLHLKLKLRTGGANEKYCQCTYYNYSFPNIFFLNSERNAEYKREKKLLLRNALISLSNLIRCTDRRRFGFLRQVPWRWFQLG